MDLNIHREQLPVLPPISDKWFSKRIFQWGPAGDTRDLDTAEYEGSQLMEMLAYDLVYNRYHFLRKEHKKTIMAALLKKEVLAYLFDHYDLISRVTRAGSVTDLDVARRTKARIFACYVGALKRDDEKGCCELNRHYSVVYPDPHTKSIMFTRAMYHPAVFGLDDLVITYIDLYPDRIKPIWDRILSNHLPHRIMDIGKVISIDHAMQGMEEEVVEALLEERL